MTAKEYLNQAREIAVSYTHLDVYKRQIYALPTLAMWNGM